MDTIEAACRSIQAGLNENAGLRHRGRYVALEFLFRIGENGRFLRIDHGSVIDVTPAPQLLRPWTFAIHIDEDAWREFCRPLPRPGYHDIFAMCKAGRARIEGDIHPFMANLRYFQELLALPRMQPEEVAHGG